MFATQDGYWEARPNIISSGAQFPLDADGIGNDDVLASLQQFLGQHGSSVCFPAAAFGEYGKGLHHRLEGGGSNNLRFHTSNRTFEL